MLLFAFVELNLVYTALLFQKSFDHNLVFLLDSHLRPQPLIMIQTGHTACTTLFQAGRCRSTASTRIRPLSVGMLKVLD